MTPSGLYARWLIARRDHEKPVIRCGKCEKCDYVGAPRLSIDDGPKCKECGGQYIW